MGGGRGVWVREWREGMVRCITGMRRDGEAHYWLEGTGCGTWNRGLVECVCVGGGVEC